MILPSDAEEFGKAFNRPDLWAKEIRTMTPEERAEKIVRDIWGYGPGELMPDTKNTIDQLAAQIAEAEREAKEGLFTKAQLRLARSEGWVLAKAKAAGVARMGRACGCPDPACAGNLIAAQIERMEP